MATTHARRAVERPQLLFGYFRQRSRRSPTGERSDSEVGDLLGMNLGATQLADATPEHARHIRIDQPVLSAERFAALTTDPRVCPKVLATLFRASDGAAALERAVVTLGNAAAAAVRSGAELLILSDDGVDATWAPIPSLLACPPCTTPQRERLLSAVASSLDRARLATPPRSRADQYCA